MVAELGNGGSHQNSATADWDGDGKAERYDKYSVTLAAGDQILITASSSAFDPVLLLQKPGGTLATAFFDDNSGGGTAARLLITADTAGSWVITITARDELATGAYDLKIVKDKNAIVSTALWSTTSPMTRPATCSAPRRPGGCRQPCLPLARPPAA